MLQQVTITLSSDTDPGCLYLAKTLGSSLAQQASSLMQSCLLKVDQVVYCNHEFIIHIERADLDEQESSIYLEEVRFSLQKLLMDTGITLVTFIIIVNNVYLLVDGYKNEVGLL